LLQHVCVATHSLAFPVHVMAAGSPGKHKQPPPLGRPKTRSLVGAHGEEVKAQQPPEKLQATNSQWVECTTNGSSTTLELHHATSEVELRKELCETEVALMAAKLWAPHRAPRSVGAPISARSGCAASVRSTGDTSTRSGGKASTEISSLRTPRCSGYSHASLSKLENQVEADQQVLQIEIGVLGGLLAEVSTRAAAWERRAASAPVVASAAHTRCSSSASRAAESCRRRADESAASGSAITECASHVLEKSHKISEEMRHLSNQCRMAVSHSASLKASIQDLCQQGRSPSLAQQASAPGSASVGRGVCGSPQRLLPQPPGKVASDAIVPAVSPRLANLSPRPSRLLQASHTEPVLESRTPRIRGNQEHHNAQRALALFRMMQTRADDNRNLCKEARALGSRVMRFLASTSLKSRGLEAQVAHGGTQERSLSPTTIRRPPQLQSPKAGDVDDLQLHLKEMPRNGMVTAVEFQRKEVRTPPPPPPSPPKSPRFKVRSVLQRSGNSPYSVSGSPRGSPLEECRWSTPDSSPNRACMQRRGLAVNAWRLQHSAAQQSTT